MDPDRCRSLRNSTDFFSFFIEFHRQASSQFSFSPLDIRDAQFHSVISIFKKISFVLFSENMIHRQ